MYEKTETETLIFIRINEEKLRVKIYIHLQGASNQNHNLDKFIVIIEEKGHQSSK